MHKIALVRIITVGQYSIWSWSIYHRRLTQVAFAVASIDLARHCLANVHLYIAIVYTV